MVFLEADNTPFSPACIKSHFLHTFIVVRTSPRIKFKPTRYEVRGMVKDGGMVWGGGMVRASGMVRGGGMVEAGGMVRGGGRLEASER